MSSRQRLALVLLAVAFLFFASGLIFFVIRFTNQERTLNELQKTIEQIQIIQTKGDKGDTPTDEELLALIYPLIPNPIPGPKGDSIKGDKGDTIIGNDGTDAQPCTTFTDENNDGYVSCPDGTQTLIPKPEEPRQIELCSTATIPLGWRYVGTVGCLKVQGI